MGQYCFEICYTGNELFRGERYWLDNDLGVILIYDPRGHIAGIQAGVSVDKHVMSMLNVLIENLLSCINLWHTIFSLFLKVCKWESSSRWNKQHFSKKTCVAHEICSLFLELNITIPLKLFIWHVQIPKDYPTNPNNYPFPELIDSPFVLDGDNYYITAYFVDPG